MLFHQKVPAGISRCSSLNCPSHKLGTSPNGLPSRMNQRRVITNPSFRKVMGSFPAKCLTPIHKPQLKIFSFKRLERDSGKLKVSSSLKESNAFVSIKRLSAPVERPRVTFMDDMF